MRPALLAWRDAVGEAAHIAIPLRPARVLRRGEPGRLLLLAVALGNSSFIGYPMVRALLGDEALPYAVVYDQFGTFVLLSTFGLYVIARHAGDAPPAPRAMVARILRFPPLWALAVGLTVMPEHPPPWIAAGLQRLADAMLPLVMLAVGLSIRLRMPRDELAAARHRAVLKLLVAGAGSCRVVAFGMHGDMLRANVLDRRCRACVTAAALATRTSWRRGWPQRWSATASCCPWRRCRCGPGCSRPWPVPRPSSAQKEAPLSRGLRVSR